MKENKFLFYGCVVITFLCAMWLCFCMPVDIEISYDVEPVEFSESDESNERVNSEDFFIDVPSDDNATEEKKNDKEIVHGNFTGCSSRFKSKIWARDLDDGQSVDRYHATNEITCVCETDGERFEKKMVYEYSSEPDMAETNCNKKCAEICAE